MIGKQIDEYLLCIIIDMGNFRQCMWYSPPLRREQGPLPHFYPILWAGLILSFGSYNSILNCYGVFGCVMLIHGEMPPEKREIRKTCMRL